MCFMRPKRDRNYREKEAFYVLSSLERDFFPMKKEVFARDCARLSGLFVDKLCKMSVLIVYC